MSYLQDYIQFYKVAKNRARSNKEYIKFEEFQAGMVMKFLNKSRINLKNKKVLDIGCGRGGYAKLFRKHGAKVTSVDITRSYFQNLKGINFLMGNATLMPFKDNSFDFIYCSSLIEHVPIPNDMVKEIGRAMKNNGICYLSFPPFWSPVGSHQFKPFHYLGEKTAIKLSRFFYNVQSYRYNDKNGKLHIRTIKQVKNLIKMNNLKIKSITTRMSPINFAKIPILNEFLTWHVQFLVKK